jgi:hypothetical protein
MKLGHPARALLLMASLIGCEAAAQTLEAARYRTAGGIEVLTNRKPGAKTADIAVAPRSSRQGREAAVDLRTGAASAEHRIAPELQASRQRERVAILTRELIAEAQALEIKRRALHASGPTSELTTAQQDALRDEVRRHEESVAALRRELGRESTVPRAEASNAASDPKPARPVPTSGAG